MTISSTTWDRYVTALRKINDTAADLVTAYIETHDVSSPEGRSALIEYAFGVATKYGEGAAAMASEMYDALALAAGQSLPSAVPASTATLDEVAKVVNEVQQKSLLARTTGSAVGRLVKMAGVDTTMQNAIRDGAEWAWVPRGDTCAFCIMLASRGWQKASQKALKNGHARHIHANCDCTYAIRYDEQTTVEGYEPKEYLSMYLHAAPGQSEDRLNAMRREAYAKNRERINAQKRSAYAQRKALNSSIAEEVDVS